MMRSMNTFVGHLTALRFFDRFPDALKDSSITPILTRLPQDIPTSKEVSAATKLLASWGAAPAACPIDITVPSPALRRDLRGVRCWTWSSPLPREAFVAVAPGMYLSTPGFALEQLASSLPRHYSARSSAEALHGRKALDLSEHERIELRRMLRLRSKQLALLRIIWLATGICGTYQLFPTSKMSEDKSAPQGNPVPQPTYAADGVFPKRKPICSRDSLLAFVKEAAPLPGASLLAEALEYVGEGSASPMETALRMSLFLPTRLGGYGLSSKKPELAPLFNYRVAKPDYTHQGSPLSLPDECCYVIDIAIPSIRLAIEYDGIRFHDGAEKRARDEARRNDLIRMGWTVITVSYQQLRSIQETDRLAKAVAACMNKKIRIRRRNFRIVQSDLRSLILPSLSQERFPLTPGE